MKHFSRFAIIALLCFCAGASELRSQSLSLPGDGKDFWVGYMLPSYNKLADASTAGFYGASLLISSYTDNQVTINYFDRTTGVETGQGQYFIPARTGIQIPLNLLAVKMLDSNGDVPEYAACHVSAKRAINVEFFSTGACSGGSFLPITTAGLGTRYVVQAYNDNPTGSLGLPGGNGSFGAKTLEVSAGFFEIIAPYNNTTVTINPATTTKGGHTGKSGKNSNGSERPYTITLQRGQCYWVKSLAEDDANDISGTIIESTHPIAVIAGHEDAALGGVSNRSLEGRDFMVEAMYPYEMWDTTGYVMIPLINSYPENPDVYEGVGENYRTSAYDKGTQIDLYQSCVSGAISMSTGRMSQPLPERFEVQCPVDFEGRNGQKFQVMMYDLRNFASAAPYPAPSMISVVPISRWRTSFLWYVPANKFETLQGYYVNVIAQTIDFGATNGIMASFNGGSIKPIKQVLSFQAQYKGTIPNYPDLTGVRYKLNPGSYYATGPHPFIVYNYGFRALDPNFDLGDFDGDDFFFSYGLPVGMKLGGTPHMRVQVDTTCSSWNVCVHDSTFGLTNQGIKSITLMDDPTGDQFDIHPGKKYHNTRLGDSLDPDQTNEINLTGDDSDVCFTVDVINLVDSGYAPLFIVDDQGGAILVELRYKAPLIRLSPDTGLYLNLSLKSDSCITFVLKNYAPKDPKDPKSKGFIITSATLKQNNPSFRISSTTKPLPTTIYAGDSVGITGCFAPIDTFTQKDTLLIGTSCKPIPVQLIGNAGIPVIWASNHDFGSVIVDSTRCDTVGVYNFGKFPFTLTKQWILQNYGVNFTFRDTANLPLILKPKQKVLLDFCYTPHAEQADSTVQNWGTDLEGKYKHSNKDSSILYGRGVTTGFIWDRSVQPFDVVCEDSNLQRVYLLNNAKPGPGVPDAYVTNVYFAGPDSAEFNIVNSQLGYTPLKNFALHPGDSIWVDIVFKADLTKTPKYADRRAQIVAHGESQNNRIIDLTATVRHADPNNGPKFLQYGTVALGSVNTRTFYLADTGNADLIIESISGITYPVVNISGIKPGDTIRQGQANGVLVPIDLNISNYTDTIVIIRIDFKSQCAPSIFETLEIAASYINPTNTGHNYDSVFLNCRSSIDSIIAQNLGTVDLKLVQIEIKPGNPGAPPQFSFDNGTEILKVGSTFRPNTRRNYHITYHPTREGLFTDSVICTWDSAGVKIIYSGNLLIGYGRLEHETFSPLQASYSGITDGTIDVPITLTKALPADVQAKGVTFSVTYRRDLLDLIQNRIDPDPAYSNFPGTNPLPPTVSGGNETLTFNLQTQGGLPITNAGKLVTLHFRVMVAKDYQSAITISDAVFWGANPQDTLCYVINDYVPAAFTPNPSCGDSSLRDQLNGITPVRIIAVTPNPSVEGTSPILTYSLNRDDQPITIELFNALGEKVRTIAKGGTQKLGEHQLPLGIKNLTSGLYVLRITAPGYVESKQFVIQK